MADAQALPIAAYSFDAGEGEVLEDLSGNGHDGAVEGGEWVERGRYGGALEFNGEKGECATVPDSEELRGREEFTLEAWVRPNSPVGDDPILFRADGGNYGEVLGVGIWSPARPEGIIGEGKSEWESVTGTEAIEANVWTHLAFTYDGAKMRLYSNGTLVGTQAQAAGPTGGAGPLVIGCNPNWTSEVFDGRIDEVRVYNRALSSQEAADVTAPTFGGWFYAILFPQEAEATVAFPEAADAGTPSGDLLYAYRYSVDGGPLTKWRFTSDNSFDVVLPEEESTVSFEIYASDAAGNRSSVESGDAVSVPVSESPEYSKEQLEEAEEAEQADADPAIADSTYSAEGSFLRPVPPNKCRTGAPEPHISTHASQQGHSRINAVGFIICGLPGVTGWLKSELRRAGPYGAYTVSDSGKVPIPAPLPQQKVQAIIDPYDCIPGTYINLVTSYIVAPPPGQFTRPRTVVPSDSRKITKC